MPAVRARRRQVQALLPQVVCWQPGRRTRRGGAVVLHAREQARRRWPEPRKVVSQRQLSIGAWRSDKDLDGKLKEQAAKV